MDNVFKKINFIIIIYLVLLVPLFFVDRVVDVVFSYDFIKYDYNDLLWYLIPPLIIIYLYNIIRKKIKLGIFDLLIFIMLILNYVSCKYAVDMEISLWGADNRHEGMISFLAYYMVFLNCRCFDNKKYVNIILKLLIVIGIFQFIYCFFQIYLKDLLLPQFISRFSSNMASGFINNPNFMGSYIILLLGFVVVKYLTNKKYYIWYFILSIIFFINLLFTQSTGPFLGFVAMIIFIFVFLIIKRNFLFFRFLLLILCLGISYYVVDYTMSISPSANSNIKDEAYTLNYDLKQIYRALTGKLELYTPELGEGIIDYRELPISKEDSLDGLGSGRIMIWRNSLKLLPKYYLFGCGLDNFGLVYEWHSVAYYDKAHNDYLQVLITRGIFSLITYLIFLLMLFIKGVKSNDSLVWALCLGFIGYSVQSFTNISVINVAPYFYMICGFMVAMVNKEKLIDIDK